MCGDFYQVGGVVGMGVWAGLLVVVVVGGWDDVVGGWDDVVGDRVIR